MPPLADSHVTSDQHGLIAIQLEQKNARYRLKVEEDGSILVTHDPVAQIAESPKETASPDQKAQGPSGRSFVPSETSSESVANNVERKQQTSQPASTRTPISSTGTVMANSSNRTPNQSSGASNSLPTPGVTAASQPTSGSDGWLQLNREAMLLLRGRGTTKA